MLLRWIKDCQCQTFIDFYLRNCGEGRTGETGAGHVSMHVVNTSCRYWSVNAAAVVSRHHPAALSQASQRRRWTQRHRLERRQLYRRSAHWAPAQCVRSSRHAGAARCLTSAPNTFRSSVSIAEALHGCCHTHHKCWPRTRTVNFTTDCMCQTPSKT